MTNIAECKTYDEQNSGRNDESAMEINCTSKGQEKLYHAGTLKYSLAGLIGLFVWLLWTDFCLTLVLIVVPNILPLKLASLGASNVLIGLLVTAIPNFMNFTFCPIVSFRSDRYRSRLGRRIPFLIIASPLLAGSMILLGLSEDIAGILFRLFGAWIEASQLTLTLSLIGVLMVFFQFFNLTFSSVYSYLLNDVVPEAYLSRFMSLFRIVGTAAGAIYNFYIFRYAMTNMREIFVGVGFLCLIAFIPMCLKVKEGKYPPPENIDGQKGVWGACKTYFVECFTHRFYWYFFLANAFWALTACTGAFGVLYVNSLGITLEQLGNIGGASCVVSILLLYPAGVLSDRYHPLRVTVIAMALYVPLSAGGLIYLFYEFQPNTILIIMVAAMILSLPISTVMGAAQYPMYMRLLPRDRYGQFGSADAMVRSAATILGGITAGGFMDLMKIIHHGDPFYYRYVPVWTIFFSSCSLICTFLVYREWKKLGGMKSYSPPK